MKILYNINYSTFVLRLESIGLRRVMFGYITYYHAVAATLAALHGDAFYMLLYGAI